jgi:LacI family transcriptional regulator
MRIKHGKALSPKESKILSENRLIVIALPLLSESKILLLQAIREELGRHGDFELMVLSGGYEALLRRLAERGELVGAIGDFMSGVWLESLLSHGVKVVRIGDGFEHQGIAGSTSVGSDLGLMGREAARVLLGVGVKGVGYLGPAGAPGAVFLGEAFTAASAITGHQVSRCSSPSGILLKNFLRSLPRPAGLLCATDHLARMAIAAATEEGLRVPQDVAVIGVGNARLESLHAGMAISSFELPLAEIGRLAGAAMADLLEGKEVGSVTVDPLLHERESSLRAASGVERALAWLKSHPDAAISAGELARLAGMSRRSFEMALRAARDISPGELLRSMRQSRAEKLLRETQLDIAAIGRDCGYPEAAAFSAAFKRWTGRSPRDFRAASVG